MPISALSSDLVSDLSQQQNPFRQIRQDFRQLASALQNGDLSDAQSAYANIQQVLQANSGSSGSGGASTLQNDFASLGQALQSGDLSGAQSAFSQLQSDLQAGGQAAANGATAGQDQYVAGGAAGQAVQDYAQLTTDIQNSDLTDAQAAYSNLQQLVQAYQGPSNSDSAIQNDFAALGQDLQTNNLTQSQSDFSQLQNHIQAVTTAPQTPSLSPAQQVRQDYTQLADALQTGNVTGAQSAFAALQQALQSQAGTSAATTTTSTNSNDPIANDLNTLGQALSSGNLGQAQSAFSQLQNDIQSAEQPGTSQTQSPAQAQQGDARKAEGHHHHHHHGGGGAAASYVPPSVTSSNSSVSLYA
jgi:hypothetical protein